MTIDVPGGRFAPTAFDDREDTLSQAFAWEAAGRRVALATVVETWGSAPRGIGSLMAIADDGDFVGSVSGGCIEGAVISEAEEVLARNRSTALAFGIENERAWVHGLACGGRIRILVAPLHTELGDDTPGFESSDAPLRRLLDARRRRRPVVLATAFAGGRRLIAADAPGPLAAEAADVLAAGRGRIVETEAGAIFLDPHRPPPRLVLVGAVHIAEPLVRMAHLLGFSTTIVDPRAAFVRPRLFQPATSVVGWPDDLLPEIGLDADTAVVALTHDPKIDDRALAAALRSDAFYIGALGSRRTHESRLERLTGAGFTAAELARIHAPIGLAIGAEGPAEIAVAIAAQIVERRRLGRA